MPHVLGHTPPLPPATSNGLPPALPEGTAPTHAATLPFAQVPGTAGGARGGVSLLVGAAIGGVVGLLVMGPLGAVIGAAAGAGAVMLVNRSRG